MITKKRRSLSPSDDLRHFPKIDGESNGEKLAAASTDSRWRRLTLTARGCELALDPFGIVNGDHEAAWTSFLHVELL